MKLWTRVGFLALACITLSCSKSAEPANSPESAQEPAKPPPPSEAPECVNEDNEVQQCETDEDCCKGFVCGKDPEQNPRLKYCLYAG